MSNILVSNRKAYHEYEITDTLEAGIVLQGCEIKSLIAHKASLDGAYAIVEKNEVWLINFHIDEYKERFRLDDYKPMRKRKLLLNRSEIKKFGEKALEKGFTLIPLSVYISSGKAKVELAVARGKQLHDKRAASKKKDAEREMKNG